VQVSRIDGADASRRAIGAAAFQPLSVRRAAPAIQRQKRPGFAASQLASLPAG